MNAGLTIAEYLEKHQLSQEEFGKRVGKGVSQGMVYQWIRWQAGDAEKGTRITAEKAIEIETASEGECPREKNRPDLFGKQVA